MESPQQASAATAALHKFIAVSDCISLVEAKEKLLRPQIGALWKEVERGYETCLNLIALEGCGSLRWRLPPMAHFQGPM